MDADSLFEYNGKELGDVDPVHVEVRSGVSIGGNTGQLLIRVLREQPDWWHDRTA